MRIVARKDVPVCLSTGSNLQNHLQHAYRRSLHHIGFRRFATAAFLIRNANFFALIRPNKKPARGVDRAGQCDQRFNRGIGVRQPGGGAGEAPPSAVLVGQPLGLVQAVRKFSVKIYEVRAGVGAG